MAANAKRTGLPALNDEKKQKAKRFNMITVIVGDEEDVLMVYEEAICKRSQFFKSACSERWVEGQVKTVRLPERSPSDFHTYLECLYTTTTNHDIWAAGTTARVDERQDAVTIYSNPSTKDWDTWSDLCYGDFISLWRLGDYLGDCHFQNKAIDGFVGFVTQLGDYGQPTQFSVIIDGLDQTLAGSGLYNWLIDLVAALASPTHLDAVRSGMSADILFDVLRRMIEGFMQLDPKLVKADRARYYQKMEGALTCFAEDANVTQVAC